LPDFFKGHLSQLENRGLALFSNHKQKIHLCRKA